VKLVEAAAESLAARLLPSTAPLLLVQPGLLARYGLIDFLRKLVETGSRRDTPAVFLLVPAHEAAGAPRIEGTLAVPGILPEQALWVSRDWLANRHNAAA
jgi:hypothetical protein